MAPFRTDQRHNRALSSRRRHGFTLVQSEVLALVSEITTNLEPLIVIETLQARWTFTGCCRRTESNPKEVFYWDGGRGGKGASMFLGGGGSGGGGGAPPLLV